MIKNSLILAILAFCQTLSDKCRKTGRKKSREWPNIVLTFDSKNSILLVLLRDFKLIDYVQTVLRSHIGHL